MKVKYFVHAQPACEGGGGGGETMALSGTEILIILLTKHNVRHQVCIDKGISRAKDEWYCSTFIRR